MNKFRKVLEKIYEDEKNSENPPECLKTIEKILEMDKN